jgi:leader peptidase (prepilin peptidase)/N-methyltransferase
MVGSFLNVCVYRIPKGLSVVRPRSRCPKCENPISWQDNIPVVSWLLLGAKCRHCGQTISWQYPLVEAITGTLFFLVFWRFGLSAATPIYMVVSAALVLVTFVDLTDWTIPDEVSLPGIPIGIAVAALGMFLGEESGLMVRNVFSAIGGAFLGAAILYGLDKLALFVLKKPGMGMGDVKLIAMLGAFFGLWGVALIIMIAAVLGSIVGIIMVVLQKRKGVEEESHYLPFGPYLSLAGIIVMFFGPQIVHWYLSGFPTNPLG